MGKEFKDDTWRNEKLLPEGLFASQVAQIRAKESKLLSDKDFQKLMQCESYEDCLHFLQDKGWDSHDIVEAETLLKMEKEALWKNMRGMCNEQECIFLIFSFSQKITTT